MSLTASLSSILAPLPATLADAASATIKPAVASPDLSWAGLILLLPAISAVLCGLCAARGVKGKLPGVITALSLLGAFALTLMLYMRCPTDAPRTIHLFDWVSFAWGSGAAEGAKWTSFLAPFSLYVDSLTLLWMLFVTGLGSLIAIYATEYMESDVGKGYARFFGAVSIFLFAMGSLVMGGNLILLYLGWEGVGLASYLLIGYYYSKPSAVAAAKKAFIVNRIGDLGLALGIFLIWVNYGTVEYDALFQAVTASTDSLTASLNDGSEWTKAAIPYCLMLGAFGKSAQFPLYVWLPDAMEGPTPVSALIHAATMVTAGIYLIARTYPLFQLDPGALTVVATIGCITALLAATIGMAQYDIKRVMAYSTVSQLGYMFLGLGVGTTFGAVYHVFTHAFFKALLFLCCGAIMHGMAGQLDLRKMSGLRNVKGFGIISWTFLIGCLCLAGFPFTAGFFSKDSIIAQAFGSGNDRFVLLGWIAVFTAFLTAYYTFRVWFRVCGGPTKYEPGDELHGHGGDDHGHGHGHGHGADDGHGHGGEWHPHGPRLAINGVLLLICLGAILAAVPAYLGGPHQENNWVMKMVSHSSAVGGIPAHDHGASHGADAHAHHALSFTGIADVHTATSVVASVAGILGIAIAAFFHLFNRKAADGLRQTLLSNSLTRWLPIAMENKWYVDEIYHATLRVPARALGHIFEFFDKSVIDGVFVDGGARIPAGLARVFQPLYNGVLQGYAWTMAFGVALIAAWVFWLWLQGGAA